MNSIESVLRAAMQRLSVLRERTDAYRLIDVETGVLPGVTVEVYGDYAVIAAYDEQGMQRAEEVGAALLGLGLQGVYLKPHLKAQGQQSADPLCGAAAPERLVVHEAEQQALIWLEEGTSTGLFLDQRDNRALLRAESRGKRVLNLFCYTGSFTVAAALGGAASTVSVDIAAKALRRTSENLALNQCDHRLHRVLKDDGRKWLGRAVRRGDVFDWVVLDPPSFARTETSTFSVAKDYVAMAQSALQLLSPGGTLLAVTNYKGTNAERMTSALREAASLAERKLERIELLTPTEDCRDAVGHSSTKSMLVRVAG